MSWWAALSHVHGARGCLDLDKHLDVSSCRGCGVKHVKPFFFYSHVKVTPDLVVVWKERAGV